MKTFFLDVISQPEAHLVLAAVFAAILFYFVCKAKDGINRYMHALTNDFSGEDSDQTAAAIRTAMLEDELRAGRNTELTRSRGKKIVIRNQVAYKTRRRGMKFGRVVALRKRGLHGQARVSHGHYAVWRDVSRLYNVSA